MTIIEKIRAEIDKRYAEYREKMKSDDFTYYEGMADALDLFEQFIDSLESEKPISPWKKIHTYTEELHEGDMEKMLLELSVGKGEKRTKVALPDSIIDFLESEKPMDLEEEVKRYYSDNFEYISSDQPTLSILTNTARHFAEWGYLRAVEKYNEIEYNRQREEGRVLPGFEDEPKGIPGKDFVPVEWVETLERYGKWKIVKLVEDGSSEIPKDLEEAANVYSNCYSNPDGALARAARRAYIAGAKWQAEQLLKGSPLPEDTVLFNKGVAEGKRLMMEEAVEADVNVYRDIVAGKKWAEFVVEMPVNNLGDKVRIIVCKNED